MRWRDERVRFEHICASSSAYLDSFCSDTVARCFSQTFNNIGSAQHILFLFLLRRWMAPITSRQIVSLWREIASKAEINCCQFLRGLLTGSFGYEYSAAPILWAVGTPHRCQGCAKCQTIKAAAAVPITAVTAFEFQLKPFQFFVVFLWFIANVWTCNGVARHRVLNQFVPCRQRLRTKCVCQKCSAR